MSLPGLKELIVVGVVVLGLVGFRQLPVWLKKRREAKDPPPAPSA